MNERIKELKRQALMFAQEKCNGQSRDANGVLRSDIMTEKFAELIVRECLEVVEKQLGGGNGDGVEWDRAIDFTYEDMKKHFGVKK